FRGRHPDLRVGVPKETREPGHPQLTRRQVLPQRRGRRVLLGLEAPEGLHLGPRASVMPGHPQVRAPNPQPPGSENPCKHPGPGDEPSPPPALFSVATHPPPLYSRLRKENSMGRKSLFVLGAAWVARLPAAPPGGCS